MTGNVSGRRATILTAVLAFAVPSAAGATTFTVTAAGDQADLVAGNGVCLTSAGTCTLRAAIQETNALATGAPHTIGFAIPVVAPATFATIVPATVLPAITRAGTVIDGTTQTTTIGNTNTAVIGTGGAVGVDAVPLPTVPGPEILIRDNAALTIGIDVQANSVQIRGLAIHGFGNGTTNGDIRIGNATNLTGVTISGNVIGSQPDTFAVPAVVAQRTAGNGVTVNGPDAGLIQNNVMAFAGRNGLAIRGAATGWTISGNEFRGNATVAGTNDGMSLEAAGTINNLVTGNLAVANGGPGFDFAASVGPNTWVNNTATGNGVFNAAATETPGFRVQGSNNTIDRNIANANFGAGVLVVATAAANRITRNSIFANGTITNLGAASPTGQIGIDLLAAADSQARGTTPFRTLNDAGDTDGGGNALTNFPILATAQVDGGNLVVTGFARPGSVIELFAAAADPSGFGEGRTYLTTVVEGSGGDSDGTTGTYGPGAINTVLQGTDTTERFRFTIPASSLTNPVTPGSVLTATSTLLNATSEFSGTVTVVSPPADVAVTLTDAPDPVHVAVPLTYTMLVTNNGPGVATAVAVAQALPTGATFTAASPSQGTCSESAGTLTCSLGTLANGGAATVTVTVVPNNLGTLNSAATVSAFQTDLDPANNTDPETTTVIGDADLSITLTDAPDPVAIGQDLTYTAVVTNLGPDPALATTLSDPLPAGLTFVSATPSQGTCLPTVTCALGTLAPGGIAIVTVVATVTSTPTITNTASVTSASNDVNAANNTASTATTVTAPVDLTISATAAPAALTVGDATVATFTITNTASVSASGVAFVHVLPVGVTLRAATASAGSCTQSGQTVTCTIGALAPGAAATVALSLVPTLPGQLTISGTVGGNEADPTQPNIASTAVSVAPAPVAPGIADLALTVNTSRSGPSPAGHFTAITAIAVNRGNRAATDLTMTLRVTGGSIVSVAKGSGTCTTTRAGAARTLTCRVDRVEAGGTTTVATIVRATGVTRIAARGSITAAEPDPTPADATDVGATRPPPAGRLMIAINAPRRVRERQVIPYTVTVRNPTSSVARDVVVAVGPPAAGPSGPVDIRSVNARTNAAASPLTLAFGDLAPGATRVVSLSAFTGSGLGTRQIVAAAITVGGVSGAHIGVPLAVRRGSAIVPVTG